MLVLGHLLHFWLEIMGCWLCYGCEYLGLLAWSAAAQNGQQLELHFWLECGMFAVPFGCVFGD